MLSFNKLIRSVTNNEEEVKYVRKCVLEHFKVKYWKEIPINRYGEVAKLIMDTANSHSTKISEQLKSYYGLNN